MTKANKAIFNIHLLLKRCSMEVTPSPTSIETKACGVVCHHLYYCFSFITTRVCVCVCACLSFRATVTEVEYET
jgi:hypothetical protein